MIPFFQKPVPLAYEVDPNLLRIYIHSFDLPPREVLMFANSISVLRFHHTSVEPKDWSPGNPCWILRVDGHEASFSEARKAAFVIADEIALLPAFFYEILPDHYNENHSMTYKKFLKASCVFGQPCCIRPSHLRIRTRDNFVIQTLYDFESLIERTF